MDLWIKALHVIAVISWMAGLLYLPRLFVYHCDAAPGSKQSETFKVMEMRLLRVIMGPAMAVVWITGGLLAWRLNFWKEPWFHGKLALVVALTVFHVVLWGWAKAFAADRNSRDARYFRLINEVPTVLMIGIIVLVIVKPF